MNLNICRTRRRRKGSTLSPGLGPAHDPESQGKMDFRKFPLFRQFHSMAWQQVKIKLNHLSNKPEPSKINHQFHVQLKYHIFLFSQQSFGHILANPERICMNSVGRESTRCIVFFKAFSNFKYQKILECFIFFSFHFSP